MTEETRPQWPYTLSRRGAISMLDRITDRDDPYWSNIVEELYDEKTDTMPTIYDLFAALGVSVDEYKEVTGAENPRWPTGY